MPGDVMIDGAQPMPATVYGEREVSDQDKKLAIDYQSRIDSTLSRPAIKTTFKDFENNRQRLRHRFAFAP